MLLRLTSMISGLGERLVGRLLIGRGEASLLSNSTVAGEAGLEAERDGEVLVLEDMRTGEVRVPVPSPERDREGDGGTGGLCGGRPVWDGGWVRGLIGGNLGLTRGVRGLTRGVRGFP